MIQTKTLTLTDRHVTEAAERAVTVHVELQVRLHLFNDRAISQLQFVSGSNRHVLNGAKHGKSY